MQARDEPIEEIVRLMIAFGKRSLSAFPNQLSKADITRFTDAISDRIRKDSTLEDDQARKRLRERIRHDPGLMKLYGFRATRKR
jgi:hypothetical protein